MPAITPDDMIVENISADETPCGPSQIRWISEAGGLTQFGAFVEVLEPGSRSALKHWHSEEDEMVYVLEGEVTLIEGDAETTLRPRSAATFRAGEPVGHYLENRSASPTRCMIVGTRAPGDRITYPDHGKVLIRNRADGTESLVDSAGRATTGAYND